MSAPEFGQVPAVDPSLAALASQADEGTRTMLDEALEAKERQRSKKVEPLEFNITNMPGWSALYRVPATAKEYNTFVKATSKLLKDDPAATARLGLAACCVGVAFNDEQWVEDNGDRCTWASAKVREFFEGNSSTESLTNAYRGMQEGVDAPGDGEIMHTWEELTDAAGFGSDSNAWRVLKDPT